jgi:hypothetical protein
VSKHKNVKAPDLKMEPSVTTLNEVDVTSGMDGTTGNLAEFRMNWLHQRQVDRSYQHSYENYHNLIQTEHIKDKKAG